MSPANEFHLCMLSLFMNFCTRILLCSHATVLDIEYEENGQIIMIQSCYIINNLNNRSFS